MFCTNLHIGVPAWRGLSKTVGDVSLKPKAYADGAPDSLPNQTPKRRPVLIGRYGNFQE